MSLQSRIDFFSCHIFFNDYSVSILEIIFSLFFFRFFFSVFIFHFEIIHRLGEPFCLDSFLYLLFFSINAILFNFRTKEYTDWKKSDELQNVKNEITISVKQNKSIEDWNFYFSES